MRFLPLLFIPLLFQVFELFGQENGFQSGVTEPVKPWTNRKFENNPDHFQFAIVTDRTGGHRDGVFEQAVEKLNLLMPEFVMSVGDLIEGYTKDLKELEAQWTEFDSILQPLNMRFFYIPGNHDVSNEVMRAEWMKRYGRAYYHFVYKNVLFLALDSNDGDDDGQFSKAQVEYFKKAIADHPNVRWTLLFMHHPAWHYKNSQGFREIEAALQSRPYTVFAGHNHQYYHETRNDRKYYVLATTGGGSALRGPKFGEFDHVTWVTMNEQGPVMVNLKLDGLLNHDLVTPESSDLAAALIDAANFESILLASPDKKSGKLLFGFLNSGKDTLHLNARVFHNHHLELAKNKWKMTVAPGERQHVAISWKRTGTLDWEKVEPVEIDFSIGYRTAKLEPEFRLNGSFAVPKSIDADQIKFSEPDIFADTYELVLEQPFSALELRYTTDGSVPTKLSPKYTGPIKLTKTCDVKVALADPVSGAISNMVKKNYRKLKPYEPMIGETTPGLRYRFFEGSFEKLPALDKMTPVREGIATDFDVEKIAGTRIDHYAMDFSGLIEVPEDGMYTFYLRSDDGSKMYIHDRLVVDNDGSHSAKTKHGFIPLKKGKHPIVVEYFEDFLGQELRLSWKKPGASEAEVLNFINLSH